MHPHIHLCMCTCTRIGMMRWGYGQMPSWGATVLLSLKLGRKPSQTWRYHTPVSQAWCALSEELGGVYLAVHLAVVQMRTHDPKRLVPKPQRLQDVPLVVPSSLGKNVYPIDPEQSFVCQTPGAAISQQMEQATPQSERPVLRIRVTEGCPGGYMCQHYKHFTLKPSEKGFFITWADFSGCQSQKILVVLQQPKQE